MNFVVRPKSRKHGSLHKLCGNICYCWWPPGVSREKLFPNGVFGGDPTRAVSPICRRKCLLGVATLCD